MDNNPIQQVKKEEEKASNIINDARELAKKSMSELISKKEEEMQLKTGEANKEVEENLEEMEQKYKKEIDESREKLSAKTDEMKNKSKKSVNKAADLLIKKFVN